MKVEILPNFNGLKVTREPTDKKFYGMSGESLLLYKIKRELQKQGYDVIKKRIQKDGHLFGDETMQYIRTRNPKSKDFMVNHCRLKQTAFPYPATPRTGEKSGWFTVALLAILPAALVSAGAEYPQDTQEKMD